MASLRVECLRCGDVRVVYPSSRRNLDAGECPHCGYVGWAVSNDVGEPMRKLLRQRPLERRRLHPA
jgi:hypothetical protein